ncbi:MAG: Ferredoxin [uncultured Thermomicrobiales bacterium]|uniref:Ferredoxin n=1 Tax=uncultured Thermomicrobiales bacterium TaxID=1645740 RepID=A0A6J4UEW3_9BACT|nr:MAG: Ferredoxin [uncultured Thermomicrobiales bacterium]
MPTIKIDGIGESGCDEGRRLVLCIEDAGVDILHRCGGNARCTTCRVAILDGDPGPMTGPEAERLGRIADLDPTTRLSCQVQVRSDLSVRVLHRLRDNPDMDDPGPRPIEWPADGPLPPE